MTMRYSLQLLIVSVVSAFCFSCTNYQEADVPDALKVDVTELSFSSGAATRSVTVQSGTKWTVGSMPQWVSVQSINSSGFQWGVTFAVSENTEYDREGVIAINSGSGSANIAVSQQGKKGQYVVISVTGVSLDKSTLTLTEGETSTLTATVAPANATNKEVTWSSSNTDVATVSNSGVVSAKAVGNATITVMTVDGNKVATCSVKVNAAVVPVTGVSFNSASVTMTEGESLALVASVTPSNATNQSLTWSSNNTTVATVSANGVVTAKKVGTVTITVITVDGGKTATCLVTVKLKDTSGGGNEGTGEDILF